MTQDQMGFELGRLSLSQQVDMGSKLRTLGEGTPSLEATANLVIDYLFQQLVDEDGEPALALARMYKTHPCDELPDDLRDLATANVSKELFYPFMKCLTLVATRGIESQWNDRRLSKNHQTIPLPSEDVIEQSPMIAQLVRQFGLELGSVIEADPELIMDLDQKTFNVFHVEEALGSPYIPAQEEFVAPYGIRSAIGFGGMFSSGDLFACILFSRVPVTREVADLFGPIALSTKLALLAHVDSPFLRG